MYLLLKFVFYQPYCPRPLCKGRGKASILSALLSIRARKLCFVPKETYILIRFGLSRTNGFRIYMTHYLSVSCRTLSLKQKYGGTNNFPEFVLMWPLPQQKVKANPALIKPLEFFQNTKYTHLNWATRETNTRPHLRNAYTRLKKWLISFKTNKNVKNLI